MTYRVFLIIITLLLFASFAPFSTEARADYFVWNDEKTGALISFPDTWHVVNNQNPGDIITLAAPIDFNDIPQCRLNVLEDHRYMIFPKRYARAVQMAGFGQEFWKNYIAAHYPSGAIEDYQPQAGLGKGFGSFVFVNYKDDDFAKTLDMRAMVTSAHYAGRHYIFECKARQAGFEKWRPVFQSIAGSVDMQKIYTFEKSGYYRDFLKD